MQTIVKTRKSETSDFLIDYERVRELLRLLVETVAGKTLVWKETQDREMTALRNMSSEIQFGRVGKFYARERELRRKEAILEQQTRALGEAVEDKLLEAAVAQRKKGVIFLGKCPDCRTKSAIMPGPGQSLESFHCSCCYSTLKPIHN